MIRSHESAYVSAMPDEPETPSDRDALIQTVAHGLLFQGRKRIHHADQLAAHLAAEKVVEHLMLCGYRLTKGPPREAPRVPYPDKQDR